MTACLVKSPDLDVRERMDPAEFRRVLSNFATGLTIITAMTDEGPVGFTCQSFASLSLDPPMAADHDSSPLLFHSGHYAQFG